jgi:WD40 repeat protein
LWAFADGIWKAEGEVDYTRKTQDGKDVKGKDAPAGEAWAVALSSDGQYLVGTTYDGRINVWDLDTEGRSKMREMPTKGSFGMCVDLVYYIS